MSKQSFVKQQSSIKDQIAGLTQDNVKLSERLKKCDENILTIDGEYSVINAEIEAIILSVDEGTTPRSVIAGLHKKRNSLGDDLTEKNALRKVLQAKIDKQVNQITEHLTEVKKLDYKMCGLFNPILAEYLPLFREVSKTIRMDTGPVMISDKLPYFPDYQNMMFYKYIQDKLNS
jgi:hypothetical protein